MSSNRDVRGDSWWPRAPGCGVNRPRSTIPLLYGDGKPMRSVRVLGYDPTGVSPHFADVPPERVKRPSWRVLGYNKSNTFHRWGDYSSMAIDPVDDCTFWYAQEYMKTSGAFSWSTRLEDKDVSLRGRTVADSHTVNIRLSHNPNPFDRAAQLGIDLSLSGGGQVAVEFKHCSVAAARLLTLYIRGCYQKGDAQRYVNRRIGTITFPIRLGARPEITVFELERGV